MQSILPHGVYVQAGAPPPPPQSFDESYSLPSHNVKPLQLRNHHPTDRILGFEEENHIYYIDDGDGVQVPVSTSVTPLAHHCQRPFDAKAAIDSMRISRKQSWPRKSVVRDCRPIESDADWSVHRGTLLVCGDLSLSVLHPNTLEPEATFAQAKEMLHVLSVKPSPMDGSDEFEFMSFERTMTDEEIQEHWQRKGMLASHMGTEAHYLAELFFNGLPTRWWEEEMRIVKDFAIREMVPRGIVAFNTEKEIYCREADVAGSIDLILHDPATGVHHILDFKRTETLPLRGYAKMNAPFSHLDDCKGAAYALQVSIYQYILENYYDMTIGDRILLSIHPNNEFVTSVPYLKAEAEFLIRQRVALVRARQLVTSEFEHFQCAVTKAPVVDAVRLDDGRVVMEKVALLHRLQHTIDDEMRRAFDATVSAWMEHPLPEWDPKQCTLWRKLMPTSSGIRPFL